MLSSLFLYFVFPLSPGSAYAAPEVMHVFVPSGLNSFASCSFRAFMLSPFAPSYFLPFVPFLSPGSAYAAPEVMHAFVPSGLNLFTPSYLRAFVLSPFVPFLSPRVPLMLHPRLYMISSLRDLIRSPLVPFAPSYFLPFVPFLSPGSAYAAPEVMHDFVPSGLNSLASCSFRAFMLLPFRAFPLPGFRLCCTRGYA